MMLNEWGQGSMVNNLLFQMFDEQADFYSCKVTNKFVTLAFLNFEDDSNVLHKQ